LISEFGNIYNQFFRNYFHETQNEIHFIADAAKGKTHLSCDIAYKKVHKSEPAIFLTGNKFTDETSITDTIRKTLDLNQQYSFDEFIQALDVYGSIVKSKIPIIIDGLNETTFNRHFSSIWKNHLSSFISKTSTFKNLIVITTCRNSYKNRIWEKTNNKNFHYLHGFDDYETIREAVNKYFKRYNLKADLFFAPLEKFREPIFLKIFCEIKNPNWKTGEIVEVNIEEESTFDIFNEYLNQVNKRVTANSHLLKDNEPFIFDSLSLLSDYLWENNAREIPIQEFYGLVDDGKEYQKDNSKAEILIHEGLVITRDIREDFEYVSFTYDILAGYIISENLIKRKQSLMYFVSNDFIEKIKQENEQHPLFEDVLSSLCLLLPLFKETSLHELLDLDKKLKVTRSKFFKYLPEFIKDKFSRRIAFADYSFNQSITSLFRLPAKYVKETDTNLVINLFTLSNRNKKPLFDLSFKTLCDSNHPLNALFVSKLLSSIKMNQRDISWTEYIRKRAFDLKSFIEEFESQCKNETKESKLVIQKQHLLAKLILWFLTSTNISLRDHATRALYYYGRKFPSEFAKLVYESLKINDPYVWERSLASLYGVTMAEHNSFKSERFRKEILPEIGKNLYELMFSEDAPYSTTHILARDYARRTIEICLIHHHNLLSTSEIENVRPSYSRGGIRNWGEYDYSKNEYSYSGPIHMDFSNYTIGRIVKDGGSYSNPPEKVKVRKQIYWRIHDLGWSEGLFEEAETALGNDNYYGGRTKRAKVERYGKKYSWMAYFENAGLRDDLGLIDREWDGFRISNADIDPSFPNKPENKPFITHDLLGDRNVPLVEWCKKGGMPFIEDYLSVTDLKRNQGEWLCLDGYCCQEDVPAERQRFTFIRGLLIKDDDYPEVLKLFEKQNLGGRWLPEKRENYYTYAGEMFLFRDATYDNYTELEFEIAKKKVKIKKGEPGYYPSVFVDIEDNGVKIGKEFPEEIEREVSELKVFEILLPVIEYNWESHHSHLNQAGHVTVVSKEIVTHLNLVDQPQSFDLFEKNGSKASMNVHYHKDYNNNHSFVYIRKDLLNKFLLSNKLKFVWAICGERDVTFKTEERRQKFFSENPFEVHQAFQKIVDYTK